MWIERVCVRVAVICVVYEWILSVGASLCEGPIRELFCPPLFLLVIPAAAHRQQYLQVWMRCWAGGIKCQCVCMCNECLDV